MSTENEYVATALAEKRLKEVLDLRFGDPAFAARMADILLANSEIEYLPRKKAVSIRLRIPETAATPSASKLLRKDGSDPTDITNEAEAIAALNEGAQRAQAVEDAAVAGLGQELPHDRGVTISAPGTVGRFEPRAIDPSDYDDEGAFFTE